MPSRPGTRASDEKEESLKKQYPLLEGVTASKPSIIVDMHGVIVAWYLPEILSNSRRVCSFSMSNHIENLTHSECNVGSANKAVPIAESASKQQLLVDFLESISAQKGPSGFGKFITRMVSTRPQCECFNIEFIPWQLILDQRMSQ